jgi:hypothetical protein
MVSAPFRAEKDGAARPGFLEFAPAGISAEPGANGEQRLSCCMCEVNIYVAAHNDARAPCRRKWQAPASWAVHDAFFTLAAAEQRQTGIYPALISPA